MRGKMKALIGYRTIISVLFLAAAASLLPVTIRAQDVRLRPGDRVELTVPQRSELDRQLIIDEAGRILLPIIGNVSIGGMTLEEAESVLLRALREIYPSVNSISVNLIGEESRRLIYVHGEVENPGKYGFEKNPTVWEAIREAGGATAEAALETVRIIRAERDEQRTFIVDLQAAIESGSLEELPVLEPGDAVIVSQSTAIHAGTGSVRVIGAVRTSGPYVMTGEKTLVDAILASGGPADNANLEKVHVIRTMPDGAQMTMTFDFKRYLETGDIRHNPLILPDDTVHVPAQSQALNVLRSPAFWLAAITAYGAVYAIVNR
jgi:protein involved in polysaccharide export with SLBB domain